MKIHLYTLDFLDLDSKIFILQEYVFVITSILHTHYIWKEEKNPLDGIFGPLKQTNTWNLTS